MKNGGESAEINSRTIAEPTFNAGNIAVTAGNYTIRFIPQCDGMNLLTLTKN